MVSKRVVNGVEYERRDFVPTSEPWTEYFVEKDGVRIRLKLVMIDVYVAPGKFDGQGRPLVNYSTTIVAVSESVDDGDRPAVVSA